MTNYNLPYSLISHITLVYLTIRLNLANLPFLPSAIHPVPPPAPTVYPQLAYQLPA